MKPETAAKLFTLALVNDDLDAMAVACQHQPWLKVGALSNPLLHVAQQIQDARRDRKLRVADTRARLLPFLDLMARHGYSPTGPALVGLAEVDATLMGAFARVAYDFSDEHRAHALILHRMMGARKMQAAWIKPLLAAGFEINRQDRSGDTPAHCMVDAMLRVARKNANTKELGLELVQAMLDQGANFSIPNAARLTPADGIIELSGTIATPQHRQTLSHIVAQLMQAKTQKAAHQPSSPARRL